MKKLRKILLGAIAGFGLFVAIDFLTYLPVASYLLSLTPARNLAVGHKSTEVFTLNLLFLLTMMVGGIIVGGIMGAVAIQATTLRKPLMHGLLFGSGVAFVEWLWIGVPWQIILIEIVRTGLLGAVVVFGVYKIRRVFPDWSFRPNRISEG